MAPEKDSSEAEEENIDLLPDKSPDLEEASDLDTKVQDDLEGLPIDRGWAWVILFAATFEVFVYGGLMKSLGVFLIQFMARFKSTASETVLVQTVSNIVVSVSGIFVMNIGMSYMTARTSVCIGSLVTFVAYLIAAFTTDLGVLILTLGVMAGVAAVLIYLPIVATIGIYFNKRRGLANSLTVAGASLGGLVFGPMYTTLFDYYGYTGTMLISSAVLLNMLISGVLLRPPEFYTKRKKKAPHKHDTELQDMSKPDDKYNDSDLLEKNGISHVAVTSTEPHKHCASSVNSHVGIPDNQVPGADCSPEVNKRLPKFAALNFQGTRTISYDPETSGDHIPPSPLLQRPRAGTNISKRIRHVSESSHGGSQLIDALNESKVVLYSATDIMYGSVPSLILNKQNTDAHFQGSVVEIRQELPVIKGTDTCLRKALTIIMNFLKRVFDVSLLREPVFIHFLCFCVVALPGSVITNVYVIPYAKDIGISNQKISVLLVVVGCVDLVSRVSVGVFADRKLVQPTTIVATAFTMLAIVNNFLRLVQTFEWLMVFVIIQVSLSGVYLALYAVIIVENVGMAKFKSALGFTSMFHGASVAIVFPLTGMLRDRTGAYYWTYHMLSVLLLIGAALAFTLPLTHRRTRRETQDENKQQTKEE